MNIDAINRIAAIIRQYPNRTDPAVLAAAIAGQLGDPGRAEPIANVIRRVNPDHTVGAGALAEHIYTDAYGVDSLGIPATDA